MKDQNLIQVDYHQTGVPNQQTVHVGGEYIGTVQHDKDGWTYIYPGGTSDGPHSSRRHAVKGLIRDTLGETVT